MFLSHLVAVPFPIQNSFIPNHNLPTASAFPSLNRYPPSSTVSNFRRHGCVVFSPSHNISVRVFPAPTQNRFVVFSTRNTALTGSSGMRNTSAIKRFQDFGFSIQKRIAGYESSRRRVNHFSKFPQVYHSVPPCFSLPVFHLHILDSSTCPLNMRIIIEMEVERVSCMQECKVRRKNVDLCLR